MCFSRMEDNNILNKDLKIGLKDNIEQSIQL